MNASQPESLDDWRARIDVLNAQLVKLLNERARCAEQIVACKQREGLPVFDSQREKAVLDTVSAANEGPLSDEALHRIFNSIMEEHRLLQEQRKADGVA
ncbi:MAG TPA: chorismate mutase [Fibrobacteria bacterium]|jgi:chorismate mutase|nr:chorismate mutase [Fibrobacteria bacterium]